MADISSNFLGVRSPNPFWLASAPPTDKAYNVIRAFEAGWGGVVWKTLGLDPPVVNVSSRYGAVSWSGQRIAGLNNIELISDRRGQTQHHASRLTERGGQHHRRATDEISQPSKRRRGLGNEQLGHQPSGLRDRLGRFNRSRFFLILRTASQRRRTQHQHRKKRRDTLNPTAT